MCRLPVTARGTGSDWLRPLLTSRAAGGANDIYIYIYCGFGLDIFCVGFLGAFRGFY